MTLADQIINGGPYRAGDLNPLAGGVDYADLNALRDELIEARQQRAAAEEMRALLADLVDPDPCWFDHHGGCQAHGYLSLELGEKCPNAAAQGLLAAPARRADEHTKGHP